MSEVLVTKKGANAPFFVTVVNGRFAAVASSQWSVVSPEGMSPEGRSLE
jgi:hypothetical protein